MRMVKLSETLSLSAIIQGFWRIADWNMTTHELVHFMHGCIERGVTTFDTAEIYAGTACESMMGQAFRQDKTLRPKIQLVTKTGIFRTQLDGKTFGYYNTTYPRVKQSCTESLQRLCTDYIDLYLIHREDPCFDPWQTAQALNELKAEGLVREVGVSNFAPFKFEALNKALGGGLVTNQIEWNPVCYEHFNSGMIDYLAATKFTPWCGRPWQAAGSLPAMNPPAKMPWPK